MRKMFLPTMMMCALVSTGQTSSFTTFGQSESNVALEQLVGNTPQSYELLKNSITQRSKYQNRTKRKVSEGKAEVILEAHKVFGEFSKSGFQMLLDADATAYGELFYDFSLGYYGTSYDDFEYKIPENADASETTENTVLDGEVAIEIPAGKYDYMIVYPFPGEGMVMPNGDFAKYDDFEFKEGNSYRFVCEYQQNEFGYNQVFAVLYADVDAAVTSVTLPGNGMDLGAEEEVTIEITNRGVEDITGFKVYYQVNENEAVSETYTGTIAAGESATYTFATKVDMTEEILYSVKAWVELEGDMISSNDSATGKCKHIGVQSLPFVCNFTADEAEAFASDWIIQNLNGDSNTWQYNEWTAGVDGTMGAASCSGSWMDDMTGNDYLFTPPLNLKAGDNHLIFYTKCINPDYATELLDVRFGTSTDPDNMTIAGDYVVDSKEWVKRVVNFNVAEDGVYYMAFHAKSVNGSNQFIDDVTIDAGYFEVSPELVVDKVILPYSTCDLSAESKVGVVISNKGTGATSTFTLAYSVNSGTKTEQEITDVINPNETKTYYFDETTDLSEVGKYNVTVEATVGETVTSGTGTVENYDPITEFPITTNFPLDEGVDEYWNQMTPETWVLDTMMGANYYTESQGLENGLMTKCLYLDTPVRFKMQYRTGGWGQAGMYIAFGKAGTDVSTYSKVYEDNECASAMEVEFTVTPEEAGSYNFIVVNNSSEYVSLYLGEVVISKLEDYDVRILDVNAPVANYTPLVQLQGEGEYVATVENRGLKEMTGVKVSLYNGSNLIATSESTNIPSAEVKDLSLKATLPTAEVGTSYNLSVRVEGDVEDAYDDDNYYDISHTVVTESTYAYENLEEFTQGTGAWGGNLYVGNVYNISVADELTSVKVAFSDISDDSEAATMASKPVAVAVYELNDDYTIGRQLAKQEFERGLGGLTEIELDPMLLTSGMYFFEVQQLSTFNMGLAYEENEDLFCWQNIDGKLNKTSGVTLVIRAEFATDAVVYEKDGAVVEFATPVRKQYLYSDSETVTVRVKNKGAVEATLPVSLTVNGENSLSSEVTLKPYEVADVEFKGIDLSTPGNYELVATVALEGDENTANDSLTETFISEEEVNQYTLDFESCYDFDANGDTFNPRWRTVARLDYEVDSFWAIDYPHKGEPVGFMAFNPEATTPAVTEDLLPGFYPNSGRRFGVAFCTGWEGYQQGVTATDTWLISPKLLLGEDSSFELYVKTRYIESQDQQLEKFNLLVSDTDDNFESFKVLGDEVREAPLDWTKVEADLSEYDGKEVYVAVQYVGVVLQNVCLMVDDLSVKTTGSVAGIASSAMTMSYSQQDEMLSVKSDSNIAGVEIYNAQGQLIYKVNNLAGNTYEISMSEYASGIYVAKAYNATGDSTTTKFAVR